MFFCFHDFPVLSVQLLCTVKFKNSAKNRKCNFYTGERIVVRASKPGAYKKESPSYFLITGTFRVV